jgi:hypothetical protein
MGHACSPNQKVELAHSTHRLPRLRVFVGVKIAPTIASQLAQLEGAKAATPKSLHNLWPS